MKKYRILNYDHLRILALMFMLMDHMWGTVVPGNPWLHYLGRLAFPIFAFQIVEGYRHTRDFNRYCKRLLIFGLISEIPFNLMISGSPVFPFHQNVMFTFLLSLLAMREIDRIRKDTPRIKSIALLALICLGSVLLFPDYGSLGLATVVVFHLLRDVPGARWFELLAMIALHVFCVEGEMMPLFGGAVEFPVQGIAVLALIPIWMYNGEKGSGGKRLQAASYLFYPAHMLVLWLISIF